jgi:predicted NAD/FAD-binding protein
MNSNLAKILHSPKKIMKKIAIIGGGISGLSCAKYLKNFEIVIF